MNKASKLKKISAICAAFMFALLSIFAALVTQKEDIRASAAEGTEATRAETPEVETIYPTDNLFDESLVTSSDIAHGSVIEIGGNYFIVRGDVSDSPGDSSYANGWFRPLYSFYPSTSLYLRSGNIITISADYTVLDDSSFSGNFTSLFIHLYGTSELFSGTSFLPSVGVKTRFSASFTIPDGKDGFYYPVFTLNSLEIRIENIMINIGKVAFPYRPYNKFFYDKGYAQGKVDGKEEGYKEGYAAASDDLSLGVLKGSKISAIFTYENGTKTITDEEPVFTYNGIDLSGYASKYYYNDNNSDYILETADVTITFAEAFTYEAFPIGFYGSSASVVYGGYFIGLDGKQYSCERDVSSNGSAFKIGEGTYDSNLQVKAIKIHFGRASDTLDGTVIVQSGQYRNGYANGYNDGEFAGFSDGVKFGKKDGYEAGYNEGYLYGMKVSDNGGFFGLLTAVVDAPIQAFSSLLNFEIMGVNMKNFVLSILTFALFVVVLRWVLGKV